MLKVFTLSDSSLPFYSSLYPDIFLCNASDARCLNIVLVHVRRDAQDEYANQQGTDIVASVRRMGLITFRIAMVLSVLKIMEDGCFDKTLLCMDVDFETALTMAEVLLQHTGKVFRELPKVASTPSGSGQ